MGDINLTLFLIIIIKIIVFSNTQGGGQEGPGGPGGPGDQGQGEKIYKILLSEKNKKIFVFSNYYIKSYHSSSLSQIIQKQLEFPINQPEDSKMISLTDISNDQIYIIVKNYLYIFSNEGTFIKTTLIENLSEYIPSTLIYNEFISNEETRIFYIALININKSLTLFSLKNSIQNDGVNIISKTTEESLDLKNSSGDNTISGCDYISCQIMVISSDLKYLTCFYENKEDEIGTMYFDDELNTVTTKQSKFRKNNGGVTNIKSVLYSNKSKAFVCYINNNYKCDCLSFDIIANKWSDYEYQYLDECTKESYFFSFNYYEQTNEYILTCFSDLDKFKSIKMDSNMEFKSLQNKTEYCVSKNVINSCNGEPLQTTINYNGRYQIIVKCAMGFMSESFKTEDLSQICESSTLVIINSYSDTISSDSSESPDSDTNSSPINGVIAISSEESEEIDELTIPQNNLDLNTNVQISNNSEVIVEQNNLINEDSKMIIKRTTTNKTKENLAGNLDELMEDVELGKVYEIKADDYEVKISPINFNEYEDSSTFINFLECENTLREKNNLPKESILTVIQIEIYNYEAKSLTNQVEYAVYDDKKKKLELSVCDEDTIEINYAITNMSVLDVETISFFSDKNVDIFNIKDDFFNDICYPYQSNNSDMILKDRILNIYQNFSLCDNNCEYDRINISSKIISCNCNVKKNIETNKPNPKFSKMYEEIFTETSLGVIKCANLVFNFKNKFSNIGFLIFSILILAHAPIIIYYVIKGIEPINKYLLNEMKKFHFLPETNSPIKKRKKKINKKKKIADILKSSDIKKKIKLKRKKNYQNSINIHSLSSTKKIPSDSILYKEDEKKEIKFNYKNVNKKKLKSKNKNKNKKINYEILQRFSVMETDLKKIQIINTNNYYLIKIDANNSVNYCSYESKYYLDNYDYEDAIIYDKRSFWRLYLICIFAKQNILNTFFINSPLDLKPIKLCTFIFIYSCDFALNTLFYFSEKISDKYNYKGTNIFWFNLINNLSISLFSSIISFIIVTILALLTNSKDNLEDVFREEEKKLKYNKKYKISNKTKIKILDNIYKINNKLKYKILFFLIIEILIMIFFYYYVTAFCEVYKQTQISWIIDSVSSFLISFPIECLLALLICLLYIIGVKKRNKFLYKIAMILYNLG